jgi:hypothetical protein
MEAWAGRPIAFKPATFYLEIVSTLPDVHRPLLTSRGRVVQADHLAKQGF